MPRAAAPPLSLRMRISTMQACSRTTCIMSTSIFNEAAAKSKRELVIKKGTKSPEALAVENGEVDLVFCVSTLNHLVISGFPELTHLSPKIGQLQQLFQLVLTDGAITNLPTEIGSLAKLKLLDVSRNKLDSVPVSLYSLGNLHTLILRHNCLSDGSFPSDLPTDCLPSLHHLDIVGNCLTSLPNFVYHSKGLQELLALDNNIASLEPAISDLSNLKQIDMKRNKLTLLPFELSLCLKLKSLDLVDNPISDRRLLKLVTQLGPVKPKTVLDYVASHSPKPSSPEKKGKSKRRTGGASNAVEGDDDVEFSDNKPRLVVVRPAEYAEVLVRPEARRIRPFLICAIVRGVDLASNNNFKKFINLQTKLHDGVCKRRRAATVATHDLAKLALPLSYSAHSAGGMKMTPLGDTTPISIREFLSGLEASKTDKRGGGGKKGGKKVAAASADKEIDATKAALSKYLQFVDPQEMVCLRDNRGIVISLPPLTNSEDTKIECTSTDIWLEVTSSLNLATCKAVMDALVCEMCKGGVGISSDGVMRVEQMKVIEDDTRQLLVLYPSRTDLLDCSSISIERPD